LLFSIFLVYTTRLKRDNNYFWFDKPNLINKDIYYII
jgi:hypothetical protein